MLILHNAKIYTLNDKQPFANAIAIDDEKIISIGTNDHVLALSDLASEKIDMAGQIILPGFIDSHIHLENYAFSLERIDCETATKDECLKNVAERTRNIRPGEWIIGHGWNQNIWKEGFGNVEELDRVSPTNPVYLTAKSLHMGWVNSHALRLAGINNEIPDPEGGKIHRDHLQNPTGILYETAMNLVEKVIPSPSEDYIKHVIQKAQSSLWQYGITGIHDCDQTRCFSALHKINQDDNLHLRVLKHLPKDNLSHAIALGLHSGFGNDYLKIGSIKLFSDGALGSQTAAMFDPYNNSLSNRGILLLDANQIFDIGSKAIENNLSITVHAIGDHANHEVLDAYERLRKFEIHNKLPHLRHRIEHVQIIQPDDIQRLFNNDIIASVQPIHAPSDMLMAEKHWGERCINAYSYQSMQKNGVRITLGSDAPVESPNPFWGIHAATTRCRLDGSPSLEGWLPDQRLNLQQAIAGYTINPAYTMGMEHCLGQLSPGYFADLILLKEDPFSISIHDLHLIHPYATMVGGKWVWQS